MLLFSSLLLFASQAACDGSPSAEQIQRALDGAQIAWLKGATVQRSHEALILDVSFKNSPTKIRRTLPAIGSCETLAQAIAVTVLGLDLTLSESPASLGLPTCIVELSPADASHFLSLAFQPAHAMPFESPGAARVVSHIQWARSERGAPTGPPSNEPPGARPRIAESSRPARTLGPGSTRTCKPRLVIQPAGLIQEI